MSNYKFVLNEEFKNLESFLLNIKQLFSQNANTIHKARNELKVIEYEGLNLVVKSFKVPNLLNRYVYTHFKPSKAKKSYDNAVKLLTLGINTPTPIGYIEFLKTVY